MFILRYFFDTVNDFYYYMKQILYCLAGSYDNFASGNKYCRYWERQSEKTRRSEKTHWQSYSI